jgi:DNA processing protein
MIKTNWRDKRCYWLALHLIPRLGNIVFKNLLEKFEDPEQVFQAGFSDLMNVEGLRQTIARKILGREYTTDPEEYLRQVEQHRVRIILYSDSAYPQALRQIHDPPMVLYVKGKDIPVNMTHIAVVGSRHPTPYGQKAAEKIGQGLARRGLSVVSGMARGIDSAAHWGCLTGRGFTVAVIGTGIDVVYPASNQKLFDQITQKGAVISEFPLGTPPEPKNFPIRNRIISGLSMAVVVVEATKNSGSLITASIALDQGREVFAVPGSINSFKSAGCHFLIKQGAGLVENSDDILDQLGLNYPYAPKRDTYKEAPMPPMEASEEAIYGLIGEYPTHIDQIAKRSNLKPSDVSSLLLRMELKGIITQLPGKMFVRM